MDAGTGSLKKAMEGASVSDEPAAISDREVLSLRTSSHSATHESLPVFRQVNAPFLTQPADLELSVSIELGRVRMKLGDVAKLVDGCVLELDKSASEPVDIVINDQIVARGEVVVLNGKFAVRVLQVTSAIETTQG
jgi:flagellar motor switch protein FliN